MASKTRVVIGVSIVVALVFLAVGIVIGFFTAKASTKASPEKEPCSGEKLSTEAARYLKIFIRICFQKPLSVKLMTY